MSAAYALPVESPWRLADQDERRFDRIVLVMIIIFTLSGIIVPFLPVPEIERSKVEALPPRFAKLLIEKKKTPPPPPPKIEQELPKDKPKEKKPEPKKGVAEARKKASRSGLLALQDELTKLREHTALKKVKTPNKLVTDGTKATVKRSIIAAHANKDSGGIDTSRLSRNVSSTELAGRETTQVEAPVSLGTVTGNNGGDRLAARTIEEIQLIFDKNKGAIYSIYNRALRKNPTLRGKVVLNITIDPSGKVLDCKIISSEVDSTEFAEKLVTRVKLFNFGAKDVDTMVITYPIDFLPS
jgi:protein TonB